MATVERLAPPHDLEAEQSVLGAIFLSARVLATVQLDHGLRPEDFYREQHRLIYRAMQALDSDGVGVDTLTVGDRLRQQGLLEEAGGEAMIDSLAGAVPNVGNVSRYAEIVKEQALTRRLLTATAEIQLSVAEGKGDARTLAEDAERRIYEVAHADERRAFRSINDILHEELDKLEKLSREGTALTGTPSGYKDLDNLTGGFQPGNLIVLAARPSMGKSALVTNIAENAALDSKRPTSVALFSLEMSETELAQRFIASQARVKGDDLRKGKVAAEKWPKILQASQNLAGSRLFVDDSSDLGLLDLRAKARRLHNQQPLGLIIVDYLQLMRADSKIESRVQQVAEMSRGLKILARELEVPVIALSQLSRNVESRTDKRPMLSDLRESGAIEQDADVVIFIYRDEYYNEDTEHPGEAELIISKHRNGPLGVVTLTFQKDYPKFMNHAPSERFAA